MVVSWFVRSSVRFSRLRLPLVLGVLVSPALAQEEKLYDAVPSDEIHLKEYIPDLEAARLAQPESPSLELPAAPAAKPAVPVPAAGSAELESSAKPKEAAQPPKTRESASSAKPASSKLTRRTDSTTAASKIPSKSQAAATAQEKKPAATSKSTTAEKKVASAEKSAASAKNSSVAAKKDAAEKKPAKEVASAKPSAPSNPLAKGKPASAVTQHPQSLDPVLLRGGLTVSRIDGSRSTINPADLPSTARPRAGTGRPSSKEKDDEKVAGTVSSVVRGADGRLRVLLKTKNKKTAQVVMTAPAPGTSFRTGSFVSLDAEQIGGSDDHPVYHSNYYCSAGAPPILHGPTLGPAMGPGPMMGSPMMGSPMMGPGMPMGMGPMGPPMW